MFNENLTKPITLERSTKHLTPVVTTTFNAYDVVPFFNMPIIPNDRISLKIKAVTNMTTPNYVTMDTLYQLIAFFYEPFRNELDKGVWDKFYGEGSNNPYEEDVEIFLPQTNHPVGGWAEGTVADYLGIPTKVRSKATCSLVFRIFARIYDEYIRDEQRQEHVLISTNLADVNGSNGSDIVNDLQLGGMVPKACKLYDYFTGSKLEFQAGDTLTFPVGDTAPVVGKVDQYDNGLSLGLDLGFNKNGYMYKNANNASSSKSAGWNSLAVIEDKDTVGELRNGQGLPPGYTGGSGSMITTQFVGLSKDPNKSNVIADLKLATGLTVRDFKQILMGQQVLQNIEDGGSRYIEQLYKRWNVKANELELEIPLCLGVVTDTLLMDMVAGTAPSVSDSNYKFGSVTGLSNTMVEHFMFNHHFKQHGWLFGIVIIRPQNTYQDGVNRNLTIKSRDDLYTPEKAHLGPSPVYNYEIFTDASDGKDDNMFGVRNYGDELRFIPNLVTGQIRKNSEFSQDYKTYATKFDSRPLNDSEFIVGKKEVVDKTLTVDSLKQHQFTFQCKIDMWIRRNLPANGNGEALIRI